MRRTECKDSEKLVMFKSEIKSEMRDYRYV